MTLQGWKIDQGADKGQQNSFTDCMYSDYNWQLRLFSYNQKTLQCIYHDSSTTTKIEKLTGDNDDNDDWQTYIYSYQNQSMFKD